MGKTIVAGSRITSTREFFALVRLNIDGSLDNTFDTDGVVTTTVSAGTDRASAVMLQGTKILVVGTARPIGLANFAIVRYNSDGSLDSSFDTDGIVITNIEGGSLQSYATAVGLLPGNPGQEFPIESSLVDLVKPTSLRPPVTIWTAHSTPLLTAMGK